MDADFPSETTSTSPTQRTLPALIRVAICEDHPIVRDGLASMLADLRDMTIVGWAATSTEAQTIARDHVCDILLLDIGLRGDGSGIEALRKIAARPDAPAVLVFSGYPEEHYGFQALRLGARGYLSKALPAQEIVRAIRVVASGRRYLSDLLKDQLASDAAGDLSNGHPHLILSRREMQIFLRLAGGERPIEIARALHLSPSTVGALRKRALEAMGLASNAAITRYALERGLIR